jgi:hypothetical protein
MIIYEPEIKLENGEVVLSAPIETQKCHGSLPDRLWYAYPERCLDFVSLRSDPFLSAMVLIAQALGEDLHIKGDTSPRLLYGMNEYQQIFHYWDPQRFKRIEITASKTCPAPPPLFKDHYATLFSGGVDSFFTLHQGLFPKTGLATWPLTHGIIVEGSPDIPLNSSGKYQTLFENYQRLFEDLGLDLVVARTNLMQFSANRIPFALTLEAPTISCAMALSPLFRGLLIPSEEPYNHYRLKTAGSITPQYHNTEFFEAKSTGGAFSHLQKVEGISHWEPAQKHLVVCSSFISQAEVGNCSRCSKCMRTRFDLNILGKLDSMETLDRSFSLGDYLHWGRGLEMSQGWQKDVWNYCRQNRPRLLPLVALGLFIGYAHAALKRCIPQRMQQRIFKYTAVTDPHIMHEAGQLVERESL